MSAETDSTGAAPHAGPKRRSRIGLCYAEGPEDHSGASSDRALNLHWVVSDTATAAGCVTVENGAGQRFPVPASLVDRIAVPGSPPNSPVIPARPSTGHSRSGDQP